MSSCRNRKGSGVGPALVVDLFLLLKTSSESIEAALPFVRRGSSDDSTRCSFPWRRTWPSRLVIVKSLLVISACGLGAVLLVVCVTTTTWRLHQGQTIGMPSRATYALLVAIGAAFIAWVLRPSNRWPN